MNCKLNLNQGPGPPKGTTTKVRLARMHHFHDTYGNQNLFHTVTIS